MPKHHGEAYNETFNDRNIGRIKNDWRVMPRRNKEQKGELLSLAKIQVTTSTGI